MSDTLTFFVQGVPPSPNASRRMGWHARSDEANVWKDAALVSLHEATGGYWTPMAAAVLELVLVASTARRRDPDNVVTACKPIVDALVIAGLLPDDSFEVIRELRVRSERGPLTGVRVSLIRCAPSGVLGSVEDIA